MVCVMAQGTFMNCTACDLQSAKSAKGRKNCEVTTLHVPAERCGSGDDEWILKKNRPPHAHW